MRKLLTFLIALEGDRPWGVCSPAAAQYGGCLGACGTVSSAAPPPFSLRSGIDSAGEVPA
jgi:hypothetical protein